MRKRRYKIRGKVKTVFERFCLVSFECLTIAQRFGSRPRREASDWRLARQHLEPQTRTQQYQPHCSIAPWQEFWSTSRPNAVRYFFLRHCCFPVAPPLFNTLIKLPARLGVPLNNTFKSLRPKSDPQRLPRPDPHEFPRSAFCSSSLILPAVDHP
jgi:hypothetical protein